MKSGRDKRPFNFIKSFGQFKFENEGMIIPGFLVEGVNNSLGDDNIRGDMSIGNKG
jgi:hypothetical protein